MDGKPALRTTPDMITDIVLKSYKNAPDPRMNQILQELIKALHGFAKAVELKPDKLLTATEILMRTGHISDASQDKSASGKPGAVHCHRTVQLVGPRLASINSSVLAFHSILSS
ncbi:MAG: dioxygenase [Pseudomonadota bacterium]